jgi:hypothetical protein
LQCFPKTLTLQGFKPEKEKEDGREDENRGNFRVGGVFRHCHPAPILQVFCVGVIVFSPATLEAMLSLLYSSYN